MALPTTSAILPESRITPNTIALHTCNTATVVVASRSIGGVIHGRQGGVFHPARDVWDAVPSVLTAFT